MPTRHHSLTHPAPARIQQPQSLRIASSAAIGVAVLLVVVAAAAPSARTGALGAATAFGVLAAVAALIGRDDAAAEARHEAPHDSIWVPVEEVGAAPASTWDGALATALADEHALPVSVASVVFPRPNTTDSALGAEHERQLQVMAVRWRETLRPGDHLARLGDDHFALVLRGCGPDATPAVLERLRRSAPEASTLIAGVATWDGAEAPAALMMRAEADRSVQPGSGLAGALEDPRRLAAVVRTGLIGGDRHRFDESAESVAWLLGTPGVVITLYDAEAQHLIGGHGELAAGFPVAGRPAVETLCRDVVESGRPLVVSELDRHAALGEQAVTKELGLHSCAAVPIIDPSGLVLGTVCAVSTDYHRWSTDDMTLLRRSAARVASVIGERRAAPR
ncbi:MAG: GAF domain-containing protein [Patulibacter sp.]